MFGVQITQIANGFIISTPQRQNPITGSVDSGESFFCKDYKEVCEKLGELWPSVEEQSELISR